MYMDLSTHRNIEHTTSKEEEEIIEERLLVMSRWGFPLGPYNLAHVMKSYLDALGRTTRYGGVGTYSIKIEPKM